MIGFNVFLLFTFVAYISCQPTDPHGHNTLDNLQLEKLLGPSQSSESTQGSESSGGSEATASIQVPSTRSHGPPSLADITRRQGAGSTSASAGSSAIVLPGSSGNSIPSRSMGAPSIGGGPTGLVPRGVASGSPVPMMRSPPGGHQRDQLSPMMIAPGRGMMRNMAGGQIMPFGGMPQGSIRGMTMVGGRSMGPMGPMGPRLMGSTGGRPMAPMGSSSMVNMGDRGAVLPIGGGGPMTHMGTSSIRSMSSGGSMGITRGGGPMGAIRAGGPMGTMGPMVGGVPMGTIGGSSVVRNMGGSVPMTTMRDGGRMISRGVGSMVDRSGMMDMQFRGPGPIMSGGPNVGPFGGPAMGPMSSRGIRVGPMGDGGASAIGMPSAGMSGFMRPMSSGPFQATRSMGASMNRMAIGVGGQGGQPDTMTVTNGGPFDASSTAAGNTTSVTGTSNGMSFAPMSGGATVPVGSMMSRGSAMMPGSSGMMSVGGGIIPASGAMMQGGDMMQGGAMMSGSAMLPGGAMMPISRTMMSGGAMMPTSDHFMSGGTMMPVSGTMVPVGVSASSGIPGGSIAPGFSGVTMADSGAGGGPGSFILSRGELPSRGIMPSGGMSVDMMPMGGFSSMSSGPMLSGMSVGPRRLERFASFRRGPGFYPMSRRVSFGGPRPFFGF